MALFFMIGWDQYSFNKKRAGTHYAIVLFLHPMGSAGHVVRSAFRCVWGMKRDHAIFLRASLAPY
jgi:hypothetical protein